MLNLKEKIIGVQHPVILYEIIPPKEDATTNNFEAYVQCAVELLDSSSVLIDGINIPDIREEVRNGAPRGSKYVSKSDARKFGKRLQRTSHKFLELVINHPTVHDKLPIHDQWLKDTTDKFGIHNLILVGGESRKIKYPGPSVTELTRYITETYNFSILCGGITIPSRENEGRRLVEKGLSGASFFTSQVIYEPHAIKNLLAEYNQLCLHKGIIPKRIFLSFAPISTRQGLEFLQWLGVFLPEPVKKLIFEAEIGIGWRSMKVAKAVLHAILDFVHHENIKVPLGLNIEHISRHNFELSKLFIEELGSLYYDSYETKYNIFD